MSRSSSWTVRAGASLKNADKAQPSTSDSVAKGGLTPDLLTLSHSIEMQPGDWIGHRLALFLLDFFTAILKALATERVADLLIGLIDVVSGGHRSCIILP